MSSYPRKITKVTKPAKNEKKADKFELLDPKIKPIARIVDKFGYYYYMNANGKNKGADVELSNQAALLNLIGDFLEQQHATYADFKASSFYPYLKDEEKETKEEKK